MIISKKKFEQEIEKEKEKVREERNRQEQINYLWRAIHNLEARFDKLEGHDHDSELRAVDRKYDN